jgi:hypothetical protein
MTEMKKGKRKRQKKKSNLYFTKDHENAIIAYAKSDDYDERNKLYLALIRPAFNEMVNKIVYTYKFNSLPNIDCLKDECKVELTTILNKYDPDRGYKAFSYFSVITKNWFIQKVKKTMKKAKTEILYEEVLKEPTISRKLITNPEYEIKREEAEFWMFLLEEVDSWEGDMLKENEKKVFEAVKILLNSVDEIEIFNKKAIYLYLRELTGLNTKQIVICLNKLREKYRGFRDEWHEGLI